MALASSPLSPPPASQPTERSSNGLARQYRTTCELPFELLQHIKVYFQEAMFMQGFRLILSLISADASSSVSLRPISIPPASCLALCSTVSVHPSFTSRTDSPEKREQANYAMRVLRLVLNTTGPINAGLAGAFSFTKYDRASLEEDQDSTFQISSYYTDEGSLWARADDFWAVVGWALNCSCLSDMYAIRWKYWMLWLQFHLDVLETDWELRFVNDTTDESLLWQYIELAPGGNARARRMLRAIFADGSDRSLNEFREVFRRELKEPPRPSDQVKKREVDVNIDADVYGDYVLTKDESDISSEEETKRGAGGTTGRLSKRVRLRTPARKTSNQSLPSEFDGNNDVDSTYSNDAENDNIKATPMAYLGPPSSHAIRIRLLHLLSHIAGHATLTTVNPAIFPSLDDLYTLYVEFIKPLPLTTFQQFICPSLYPARHTFSHDAHATLCEFLLQRTLESTAPSTHADRFLTVKKLVTDYLPFAASKSTTDANCRVSLLLETLVRVMNETRYLSTFVEVSASEMPELGGAASTKAKEILVNAVEQGIQRRLSKAGGDPSIPKLGSDVGGGKRSSKKDEDGELAWCWLVESSERMRTIVRNLG